MYMNNEEWNEAATSSLEDEQNQRNSVLDNALGEYDKLDAADDAKKAAVLYQRDVALLAAFKSIAQSNDGMVRNSRLGAISNALGVNASSIGILQDGQFGGSLVVRTPVQSPDGVFRDQVAFALNADELNGVAQRLRSQGFNTADVNALGNYACAVKQKHTGWTDSQLAQAGFTVPQRANVAAKPNSLNLTTGEGQASGAKPGSRPRSNGISYFSSDGKGGMSRGYQDSETGQLVNEDMGTRDANYKGYWKLLSTGPSEDNAMARDEEYTDEKGNKQTRRVAANNSQVRTYENSKTGEVVRVKDGEIPPWEITQKDRDNEARLKEARIKSNASSSSRSGLSVEDRERLDSAKYESYKFKNVVDAYKSNPQWQALAMTDPKAAWKIINDQVKTMQEEQSTGTPPPSQGSIIGEDEKEHRKNLNQGGGTRVKKPKQAAAQTGEEGNNDEESAVSDKYTTVLTEDEEKSYQQWREKLPKHLQYEGDYDLRGYFKEVGGTEFKEGDHMPDTYKKPNHKTFSTESKYAVGEDAEKAGSWDGETYIPAKVGKRKESAFKKWYATKKTQHGMEEMPEKVAREQFESEYDRMRHKEAIDAMTNDEERAFSTGNSEVRQRIIRKVLDRIDGIKRK